MQKSTKYPKESNLTINIDSFEKGINTSMDINKIPLNYCVDLQNFDFSDGVLKNGLGFSDLIKQISLNDEYETLLRDIETIGSIEKVFHFYIFNKEKSMRDDKLIFINNELKTYYINLYDETKSIYSIRNINFTSIPVAVNYRLNSEDVIIFSSETDNMFVWNGYNEPYEVLDSPKISSMALHYERLFATVDGEKNSIWFSDDLDPTNWSLTLDEAGFIELIDERGALIKVVSFLDYVYIFRENGISRLSAYGEQSNFSISNLFVSSGKIYASSVCVCGDEIIFLASDGLYKFDGVNTIKILSNIEKNISNIKNQKVSACYYNGNYYLACKYKFLNDEDNCEDLFYSNTILNIDINTHKLKNITHGINIKYLTSIKTDKLEGVIALVNNNYNEDYHLTIIDNSGSYLSSPLKNIWVSPSSGLNNVSYHKTLKKITLQSLKDLYLTIYHNDKKTTFYIKGSKKAIIKRVNIPLNTFSFKITSTTDNPYINNLKFEFNYIKSRE